MMRFVICFVVLSSAVFAAEWVTLFNGKDTSGWEQVGNGVWKITREGVVVGQRNLIDNPGLRFCFDSKQAYDAWLHTQAWLYTVKEFGEFDLQLEYWLRYGGNSGISLRDPTRAKFGVTTPPDFRRTPSKLGYEIQLSNHYPDKNPSGSIYNLSIAAGGAQHDDDWNQIEIESRSNRIRVRLNGKVVAEHPGDPGRPKRGPIGLQLHDQYSVVMFRNARIRDLGK